MKSFFEALDYLFVKILFWPLDLLRSAELGSWWVGNIVTFVFIIICCLATYYWMKQLQIFKENKEDEQDTTAHSFLS